MNYVELLNNRRSVGVFEKDREIEEDLLKRIINESIFAPSAWNLQPWKVLLFRSKESKEKLYKIAMSQPKIRECSAVLALLGDKEGYMHDRLAWKSKLENKVITEDGINKTVNLCENILFPTEAKKTAFAVRNASLFGMTIMLTAKNYGIDSHPMIGFDYTLFSKEYDLPENMEPVMLIALGYRDSNVPLKKREERLTYEKIVKEIF